MPETKRLRREWFADGFLTDCGFTLVELILGIALIAVLASIASVSYGNYRERLRVEQAVRDIAHIQPAISQYWGENRQLPDSLADVGMGGMTDPWGNPYVYTNLGTKGAQGSARKDHKLNPINSDYDLFSAGKDGVYKTQVSQKDSLDDIIRARDGAFIGLASDFSN